MEYSIGDSSLCLHFLELSIEMRWIYSRVLNTKQAKKLTISIKSITDRPCLAKTGNGVKNVLEKQEREDINKQLYFVDYKASNDVFFRP